MAGTFLGVDPGKSKKDVAKSTSTTSKKVELFIEATVREDQAIRSVELLLAAMKEQDVGAGS